MITDILFGSAAVVGAIIIGIAATITWRWILNRRDHWTDDDEWQGEAHSALHINPANITEPEDPWADDVESWSVDHGFRPDDALDVIRMFARAGFDEVPKPGPLPVEEVLPPMLFDDLTAEYRQVNPHVAGHTATWMVPSPDIDQAIADPYQRWNGFLPQLEPAHVPAQRDGGES